MILTRFPVQCHLVNLHSLPVGILNHFLVSISLWDHVALKFHVSISFALVRESIARTKLEGWEESILNGVILRLKIAPDLLDGS